MKINETKYADIFNKFYELEKHFPKLSELILKNVKGESPYITILKQAKDTCKKDKINQRMKDLNTIEKEQRSQSKDRGR